MYGDERSIRDGVLMDQIDVVVQISLGSFGYDIVVRIWWGAVGNW